MKFQPLIRLNLKYKTILWNILLQITYAKKVNMMFLSSSFKYPTEISCGVVVSPFLLVNIELNTSVLNYISSKINKNEFVRRIMISFDESYSKIIFGGLRIFLLQIIPH